MLVPDKDEDDKEENKIDDIKCGGANVDIDYNNPTSRASISWLVVATDTLAASLRAADEKFPAALRSKLARAASLDLFTG
jgi:hypothetical protein